MSTRLSRLVLLLLMLPVVVLAETPEKKGRAIAQEADRRDSGWGDSQSALTMILRDKRGKESNRELRTRSMEVPGDGDKSLTIFDTPEDLKGTAFLTLTHKVGDDDQWLYLPSLKRVKRISTRNKSGSFMGSEFAYEDLASQELEKYAYKWIRDEAYDGRDCFVVEFYPVDEKNSGYTRLVKWIGKNEYRTWKVDYYDRKESLLKTLTITGYQKYLNKYWRAQEMEMVNHQNGKNTELLFKDYKFRTGLTDRDFDRNVLQRVR